MQPLASFLALQENPTTPFQPDLHQTDLFSTGPWVIACQQLVQSSRGWVKLNHLLLWHCGSCFKATVLTLWVTEVALLVWFAMPLSSAAWLLPGRSVPGWTGVARVALELRGQGWLCLALLLSAVMSSHDATELCRGEEAEQAA